MHVITRKIEFDAGHRVLGHGGKCCHPHGHRYVAEITISSKGLNSLGMVADFSTVKDLVGGWVDTFWDHNMILNAADPLLDIIDKGANEGIEDGDYDADDNMPAYYKLLDLYFGGREPYRMDSNPTAENMARELFDVTVKLLKENGYNHCTVEQVRIYETPNCWADAFPEAPQAKKTMWG